MKTFLLTSLFVGLVVSACGGGTLTADCKSDTYCHWSEVPTGKHTELCCPADYPYCGAEGTDCPVGDCCGTKPKAK